VLTEEQYQAVLKEIVDWKISFDARTSKTRALTFTSFVTSPLMSCLPHEWQKPGSVKTLLECEGQDHTPNLRDNSKKFWDNIQEIVDKKRSVSINVRGRVSEVYLHFKFPADMSAHWSVFDCVDAKGFIKADSQVCHRCKCTYSQLPVVFDMHTIQAGETLRSIAERYGVDTHELEVINVNCDEVVMSKFHEQTGANKKRIFRPTIFNGVGEAEARQLFSDPDQSILEALRKQKATIRVHRVWAMDRDIPETALLRASHLDSPFCMEHATQRITEFLMNIIQVLEIYNFIFVAWTETQFLASFTPPLALHLQLRLSSPARILQLTDINGALCRRKPPSRVECRSSTTLWSNTNAFVPK
jgi:hypothetical protein